jgi:hypothetical protein
MILLLLLAACEVVRVSHPYNDPEGWRVTIDPGGLLLLMLVTLVLAPWRPK